MLRRPLCERQHFLPTRNSTLKGCESSADYRVRCSTATIVSRAPPGGPLKPRRPWVSRRRSNRCCGIAITGDGRAARSTRCRRKSRKPSPSGLKIHLPLRTEENLVVAMIARVSTWLDAQLTIPGVILAVTHASVIRAAIVCALVTEPRSFWHIDIAPLSLTRLSGNGGRWTLVSMSSGKANSSTDDFC